MTEDVQQASSDKSHTQASLRRASRAGLGARCNVMRHPAV